MCDYLLLQTDIFDAEDVDQFFVELRRLQSRNKCTDKTLFDFIDVFSKFHDLPAGHKSFRKTDKQLQELAGCAFLELHGCAAGKTAEKVQRCGRFIFEADDKRRHCPSCGAPR